LKGGVRKLGAGLAVLPYLRIENREQKIEISPVSYK